jgi:hypothetical protein
MGQEVLTSDKVALRVSILTHFKVVDSVAAMEKVDSYVDRLYSDVQLAARRSLETLTALGGDAEARLYIGFDKHAEPA